MENILSGIKDRIKIALQRDNSIDAYISKLRYGQEPLGRGDSVMIPLGKEKMKYTKMSDSWDTDRNMDDYNSMLFSDIFEEVESSIPGTRSIIRPRENATILAGGLTGALGSGRIVVDLGSGEAVGLLQYAKKFPKTIFIGVDTGYEISRTPDLTKPGLQLTNDDWNTLSTIADNSVDTFLSLEGAIRHGVEGKVDAARLLVAILTKKAKDGAILRYNTPSSPNQNAAIATLLGEQGWNVLFGPKSIVAIKKNTPGEMSF